MIALLVKVHGEDAGGGGSGGGDDKAHTSCQPDVPERYLLVSLLGVLMVDTVVVVMNRASPASLTWSMAGCYSWFLRLAMSVVMMNIASSLIWKRCWAIVSYSWWVQ